MDWAALPNRDLDWATSPVQSSHLLTLPQPDRDAGRRHGMACDSSEPCPRPTSTAMCTPLPDDHRGPGTNDAPCRRCVCRRRQISRWLGDRVAEADLAGGPPEPCESCTCRRRSIPVPVPFTFATTSKRKESTGVVGTGDISDSTPCIDSGRLTRSSPIKDKTLAGDENGLRVSNMAR